MKTTTEPNTPPNKQPEAWEDWVRTLANSENPHDTDLLIAKIKVVLASQRASDVRRLEWMRREVTTFPPKGTPNAMAKKRNIRINIGFNQAIDQAIALLQDK